MSKNKKILLGKMACVLGVIPALIWAHEYGPDPYHTSAPGDNPTSCIEAQCHVGKSPNLQGGKVEILPANGNTYTPGQTQQIVVKISDSAQKSWGFQLSARLASDPKNTQAGDFNPLDDSTQVLCGDGSNKGLNKPCSASFLQQFAEHTTAGWTASRGKVGTYSYTVNWTASATEVGDVILYVGANASNNTNTAGGGHIYTSSLTLSAASSVSGSPKPQVTPTTGVVNGATNLSSGVAPDTYITIFGSNLATTTRQWGGSDFGGGGTTLPTSLSGTSVTVNGKAAYVEYISPTQINAITPSDTAAGSGVNVVVTTNGVASDPTSITLNKTAPGFFTFDGKYVAASDATTGAFIGKVGLFPSAPSLTTPAKPGQIITLYGTGFGTTSPAIADGLVTDKVYNLNPTPVINIGSAPATVGFAALTPGFAQVYQFNVTIPANAPDGDLQIFAQTGGVASPNTAACCFITVKK